MMTRSLIEGLRNGTVSHEEIALWEKARSTSEKKVVVVDDENTVQMWLNWLGSVIFLDLTAWTVYESYLYLATPWGWTWFGLAIVCAAIGSYVLWCAIVRSLKEGEQAKAQDIFVSKCLELSKVKTKYGKNIPCTWSDPENGSKTKAVDKFLEEHAYGCVILEKHGCNAPHPSHVNGKDEFVRVYVILREFLLASEERWETYFARARARAE